MEDRSECNSVGSSTRSSHRKGRSPTSGVLRPSSSGRTLVEGALLADITADDRVQHPYVTDFTRILPVAHPDTVDENVRFDDFREVEFLSEGKTTLIFRALWKGQFVIVKMLHGNVLNDATARADFEHERNLLLRVQHPNIVQLLGHGVTRSLPTDQQGMPPPAATSTPVSSAPPTTPPSPQPTSSAARAEPDTALIRSGSNHGTGPSRRPSWAGVGLDEVDQPFLVLEHLVHLPRLLDLTNQAHVDADTSEHCPFSYADLLRVAADLAAALDYMHDGLDPKVGPLT